MGGVYHEKKEDEDKDEDKDEEEEDKRGQERMLGAHAYSHPPPPKPPQPPLPPPPPLDIPDIRQYSPAFAYSPNDGLVTPPHVLLPALISRYISTRGFPQHTLMNLHKHY
ncbi:hypothetical protein M0802_007228 [Mischocyttarus mexicanus]|nr:hypothetical protein M0802_007228 [Mischocyttarus mexicanus]